MSLLPILTWPDPVLKAVCAPVARDVSALAADMLETMYAATGRGLAAPQVGVTERLFVMDVTWKEGERRPRVYVNPEVLTASDDRVTGPEGCLSIPGVTAEVPRAAWIVLGWTDLDGTQRQERLAGAEAICAQHELDHLDGIVTFDRVDAAQRARLEAAYAG